MPRKLDARKETFCQAYIVDLNATNAAKAAGYGDKSAYKAGYRLSKNVQIQARIDQLLKKQANRLEITAEKVLGELAKLGYANMLDYVSIGPDGQADVDLTNVTREQAAAIQEIKVDATGGTGDGERRQVLRTTFKLADKGANLERLGRHLKLFTDKLEHSGLDGLADKLHRVRQRKNA